MAASFLLKSGRSGLRSIDLATRCLLAPPLSRRLGSLGSAAVRQFSSKPPNSERPLPDPVDWRKCAVTRVINQGLVDTCWSVAPVGAVEGLLYIKTKKLVLLSIQMVVDCATVQGIRGSHVTVALEFMTQYGVSSAKDYPYTGKHQKCVKGLPIVTRISGYTYLKNVGQRRMMEAVSKQPVIVVLDGVYVDSVMYDNYKKGIHRYEGEFEYLNFDTTMDHAVLVVGHGIENGERYFIIKESRGKRWGEKGFMRLAMKNSKNKFGLGGINSELWFPLMDDDGDDDSNKAGGTTTLARRRFGSIKTTVGEMTRSPKVQEIVPEISGKSPSKGVNPDEAVAGVNPNEAVAMGVTPVSLGIETLHGIFTRLINRNTTVPTKKSQIFSTAADNQTQVTVRVFQGEHELASDNNLLGEFELLGIPSAPRGLPQIEVTFEIDANGIVTVFAKDKQSGKEQQIAIKSSGGLSDSEIEKMVIGRNLHVQKDEERKSLIDLKNCADTSIYSMEKSLSEYKDKIPAEALKEIEDAISVLRQASAGDNVDEIKAGLDIADNAISKMGQHMSGGASSDSFASSDSANGGEQPPEA